MMKAARNDVPVLTLATQDLKGLLHLLESGVRMTVRVGTSLADLVCDQIGIPRDYLDGRIQTLFLNAKAVDDVNTARVEDGAVIALSAAMPGLVGATLRKGGAFSGLRAAISQKGGAASQDDASGTITLKMFNLVAREVGPDLLTRGVQLSGDRLRDFFDAAAPSDLTIQQAEQPLTIQAAAALCVQHSWIGVQLEK